jgi:hypothetical protein
LVAILCGLAMLLFALLWLIGLRLLAPERGTPAVASVERAALPST